MGASFFVLYLFLLSWPVSWSIAADTTFAPPRDGYGTVQEQEEESFLPVEVSAAQSDGLHDDDRGVRVMPAGEALALPSEFGER